MGLIRDLRQYEYFSANTRDMGQAEHYINMLSEMKGDKNGVEGR